MQMPKPDRCRVIDTRIFFSVYFQGYKPTIFYPQPSNKLLFKNLTTQCEKMDIPFLSYLPSDTTLISDSYNLIIDALFGFSFRPPVRPAFEPVMNMLLTSRLPIASIDIPSGRFTLPSPYQWVWLSCIIGLCPGFLFLSGVSPALASLVSLACH